MIADKGLGGGCGKVLSPSPPHTSLSFIYIFMCQALQLLHRPRATTSFTTRCIYPTTTTTTTTVLCAVQELQQVYELIRPFLCRPVISVHSREERSPLMYSPSPAHPRAPHMYCAATLTSRTTLFRPMHSGKSISPANAPRIGGGQKLYSPLRFW